MGSVHSGATSTLNPQTWPEFDHDGFGSVQSSFVNFGNHVFSKCYFDLLPYHMLTIHVAEVQRAERILPNGDRDDMSSLDDAGTPAASDDRTLVVDTPPDLSFLDSLKPSSIPEDDGAGTAYFKHTDPPLPYSTTTLLTTQPDTLSTVSPQNIEIPLPHGTTPIAHSVPNTSSPQHPIPPPQRLVSPGVLNQTPSVPLPQPARPPQPPPRQPAAITEAVVLDDVPQSARTAFAAVLNTADAWGSAWAACVAAFVALESLHGFDLKEYRLPSVLRPIQYKQWITAKRASDWIPSVDTPTFSTSWLAWWAEIQPPGRIEEGGITLSTTAEGLLWQKLAKTGPSGMFLVLVGLAWWRRLGGAEDVEWLNAVLDVEWALHQVLASSPPAKLIRKRKPDAPVGDSAPPPAKKRAPIPSRRALGLPY